MFAYTYFFRFLWVYYFLNMFAYVNYIKPLFIYHYSKKLFATIRFSTTHSPNKIFTQTNKVTLIFNHTLSKKYYSLLYFSPINRRQTHHNFFINIWDFSTIVNAKWLYSKTFCLNISICKFQFLPDGYDHCLKMLNVRRNFDPCFMNQKYRSHLCGNQLPRKWSEECFRNQCCQVCEFLLYKKVWGSLQLFYRGYKFLTREFLNFELDAFFWSRE